jgi:hypothetical protein
MTLAATDSGSRAFTGGDHEQFDDADSSAAMVAASAALKDGVGIVERLAKDESRTPPQRNEAAARVAEQVAGEIEKAAQVIERRHALLWENGLSEASRVFAPDLSRQAFDAEIMRWVREESAKENGVVKVHEMVRKNKNVAAVVVNSEPFLLGLHETAHERMRQDAIEAHAPKAWEKLSRSASMTALPDKLKKTAANVRRFFFDPLQRAKMGSRVAGLD